jgi:HKD family nuclease
LRPLAVHRQTDRMKVRIFLHPFADDLSLYETLEQALANQKLSEFTTVVAWAKLSGLTRLRFLLQPFRASGGTSRIVLGIDEGGASIEGLRAAITDFDEALVLHDRAAGTFHPKLYMVSGEETSVIVIGSSNLTRGGFVANYEAGVCLELDLKQDADREIHEAVAHYVQRLREDATCQPLTEDLIQQLLAVPGLIGRETKHSSARKTKNHEGLAALFGLSQHPKNQDPAPGLAASSQPAVPSHDGKPGGFSGAPHMDAASAARVEKFGEAAYRHKEIIDQNGFITRAESLAIRRQIFGTGPAAQRTVTLFGAEGGNSIMWMVHQKDGRTRNGDLVHLTAEGERVAGLWQTLHEATGPT